MIRQCRGHRSDVSRLGSGLSAGRTCRMLQDCSCRSKGACSRQFRIIVGSQGCGFACWCHQRRRRLPEEEHRSWTSSSWSSEWLWNASLALVVLSAAGRLRTHASFYQWLPSAFSTLPSFKPFFAGSHPSSCLSLWKYPSLLPSPLRNQWKLLRAKFCRVLPSCYRLRSNFQLLTNLTKCH